MRAVLFVLMVVLAGCASSPSSPADDPAPVQATPALETPWNLELTGCTAVSGVSVYPRAAYMASAASPPEPFVPADIRSEVGDARVASANGAGWFTTGNEVAGHWHTAIRCNELSWGFVGIRIEPPPFDDVPVENNILLAVWSWPADIVDEMHHIGHATKARDVLVVIDSIRMEMVLDDEDHGVYQGYSPRGDPLPMRDALTTRFWMLMPASGEHNHHDQAGPYAPIAFDMATTAFQPEVLAESLGFFAHTGTDHHAPLPGLGGNDAAVAWSGFDAAITAGPRPAVLLNETWVH